jgi:2-polyprenyl-3-methyl-5-hydroxy-6-metoxy-1,4-benzoquinol methylase
VITASELVKYPATHEAFEYLRRHYVLYGKTHDYIMGNFGEDYLQFGEELLGVWRAKCGSEEEMVRGYKAFIRLSNEFLVLQARLHKDGRYLHDSFAEVNEKVYQNEEVMQQYYLDGLLLSQVLWPNHYRMGRYFLEQRGAAGAEARILDVPSGAGIYTYYAAKHFAYQHLRSIDISPYSAEYTRRLLQAGGVDMGRITVEQSDVFALPEREAYDVIVCGELLEHVERPDELVEKLAELLREGGMVFLTTAIYAANVDHIYLFEDAGQVRQLLGWRFIIESELIAPTSLEEYRPEMRAAPINYACVLRKKRD